MKTSRTRGLFWQGLWMIGALLIQGRGGAALAQGWPHDLTPRSHPPGASGRHYAPSREIDVLHLKLDVTPDFEARSVTGQATLTFQPIARPLATLQLDGHELQVSNVTSDAAMAGWHAASDGILVLFDPPVAVGKEASVTVTYWAQPEKGMYFRTPEMGYPAEDMQLWTQGEPIEARHWFPSYDFPNEKFTTEIICHVRPDMEVMSNGVKVSEEAGGEEGLKAVHWRQEKPHANYLVSLLAGYYKRVEDRYRDIPMSFWTPASMIEHAENSFEDTKDMMAYFEREIGVPYPWSKYDQACVLDFHWGGMENTSITTLNSSTLHTDATEELRSSQGLVAHELAHQWFGDLLTCKDWSHLWLNEGFATYYEALYDGHKHGRDTFLYRMYSSGQGIARQANDTNAMVRRDYKDPEDQFSYLAYPKGSWILHMLRSRFGEDLYRRCVKTYVERHQFGVVQTQDLIGVFEELTGQSLDLFFDQYVFHAHHPELNVDYRWDPRTKLAKIGVRQVQALSAKVLLFNVALPVRFKSKGGVVDRVLRVTQAGEDFYVPLEEAPEVVRLDPDLTLLAKITFNPPLAMLHAQLADSKDMLGRLIAAEQLGDKKDGETVAKLKETLEEDGFWAVRMEASQSLRKIGTEAALAALRGNVKQKDARVRQQVASDIAGVYGDGAYEALSERLEKEKNPLIRGGILVSMSAYGRQEVREALLRDLGVRTFQNYTTEAAVRGMRAQDDPAYVGPLLEVLRAREVDFDSRGFSQALGALAFLAREQEDKTPVRDFLLGQTGSKKERVRLAAIGALGTLGDAKAMAALETFASSDKESPDRTAAERAMAALRDTRTNAADLRNLRREVTELQKENRTIREQFEALKKQFDALHAPPETNAKTARPKRATR